VTESYADTSINPTSDKKKELRLVKDAMERCVEPEQVSMNIKL